MLYFNLLFSTPSCIMYKITTITSLTTFNKVIKRMKYLKAAVVPLCTNDNGHIGAFVAFRAVGKPLVQRYVKYFYLVNPITVEFLHSFILLHMQEYYDQYNWVCKSRV